MKKAPFIILTLVAMAASFDAGRRLQIARSPDAPADTVVITRTVSGLTPAPKAEAVIRWAFFSLPEAAQTPPQARVDTVWELVPVMVHDTLYLPISQRYYEEAGGRLRLWVSGYDPKLVRWELDELETRITKPQRWCFSVGVGPGVIYTPFHSPHVDAGLGVFGGVTVNF